MVGVLGFYTIAVFDANKTFSFLDVVVTLGKAIILCGFLLIKSYLGPVMTGYTIASVAYFGYEYGRFDYVPLVSAVRSWIFSNASYYLQITYLVISSLLISAFSAWDSFDHH